MTEIAGRLSPERAEIDPVGYQEDLAKYSKSVRKALAQPSGLIRDGTEGGLNIALIVATGGEGVVAGGRRRAG